MQQLVFDDAARAEARRFNRWLAWAPRLRIRNRFSPQLVQALLRLSQLRPVADLVKHGIAVDTRTVQADGVRVPVRILRPPGPVRGVVFDVHGGGWVIGNAMMNDRLNAATAAACGVAIVSVDYRLAGATPLAGLMEDCLAALRWLLAGGLPDYAALPVIVVGESAGAHLAVATLLSLRAWPDLLARIQGAVLYYGVYDLAGTPSVQAAGPATLLLHGPGMVKSMRMLTPGLCDAERRAPHLSPLYADLRGMPEALMITGELDPLRDDTLLLAQRWREAAAVELHLLADAPHGFIRFPTRMAALVKARAHAWIGERIANAGTADASAEAG